MCSVANATAFRFVRFGYSVFVLACLLARQASSNDAPYGAFLFCACPFVCASRGNDTPDALVGTTARALARGERQRGAPDEVVAGDVVAYRDVALPIEEVAACGIAAARDTPLNVGAGTSPAQPARIKLAPCSASLTSG